MYHIRITKTASGATAVQVVRYEHRRKIIVAHIGSAHDSDTLARLQQAAAIWIEHRTKQLSLFSHQTSSPVIPIDKCRYLGFRYALIYETLYKLFTRFKFHLLGSDLLVDLVSARIIEPGSKFQSLAFLKECLGIRHSRSELYRQLPAFVDLQEQIEKCVLSIAKKEFGFTFSLVFYDVTTLYFESFESDDLRKPGFSKDNKSQQPQIIIGLLVHANGFPVAYQLFKGNTFEGQTFIPVIAAFQRKHHIQQLTVVADAAMVSLDNMTALKKRGLTYIVGARTGSLSTTRIADVSAALLGRDGATIRQATMYGDLICEFSAKRFTKDKHEMDKQIKKAEALLNNPSHMKRTKFVKTKNNSVYELNQGLVRKTNLLLGIKGYYTNLGSNVSDRAIIEHYHNLWRVELVFRIAKSDLQMRPIYHFKEKTIKAHILICFMALAVCKYMELKTGKSTKSLVKTLKSVTDATLLNTLTNQKIVLRSEMKQEIQQVLQQLGLWY